MSLFYLDSSALVKRYKTEKGSVAMDVLFEQKTSDDRLATSFLAVIEITGVAAGSVCTGLILTRICQ